MGGLPASREWHACLLCWRSLWRLLCRGRGHREGGTDFPSGRAPNELAARSWRGGAATGDPSCAARPARVRWALRSRPRNYVGSGTNDHRGGSCGPYPPLQHWNTSPVSRTASGNLAEKWRFSIKLDRVWKVGDPGQQRGLERAEIVEVVVIDSFPSEVYYPVEERFALGLYAVFGIGVR